MRVFLSYAHEQQRVAEELAATLAADRIDVFIDRADLKGGEAYHARLQAEIARTDLLVFLVSPESVKAGAYTLTELDHARRRWRTLSGRVLPIMVKDTPPADLPPHLAALNIPTAAGNVVAEVAAEICARARAARTRFRRRVVWAAAALVVGVAIGLLFHSPPRCWVAENRVTIEAPLANASVAGPALTVGGRYCAGVKDDLWVFVWPEQAPGKGWPQSPDADRGLPAAKDPRGTWLVGVNLGGPPQSYDITVHTASLQASRELGRALVAWARDGHYPGISASDLPAGLTERGRVTIRRAP